MTAEQQAERDKLVRNRVDKVRRSTLIVPGNVEKFLRKAFERGADAVQLDLEDGVPADHKQAARDLVRELLHTAELPGTVEVNVRINNDDALWAADVEAAVSSRLDSLTLPKCEHPDWIREVDLLVGALEREQGLAPGSVELSVLIESAAGLQQLEALLEASPRISTVTLGNEDFCLDMGIEPSAFGEELYPYYARLLLCARLYGVMPLGMVSSIADYRNLQRFRELAQKSRQLGFMGSSCIHPDQVAILNEVYTPVEDELKRAAGIKAAYEDAMLQGRASGSYEGKMVDPPVYERALYLLRRAERMTAKKVIRQ